MLTFANILLWLSFLAVVVAGVLDRPRQTYLSRFLRPWSIVLLGTTFSLLLLIVSLIFIPRHETFLATLFPGKALPFFTTILFKVSPYAWIVISVLLGIGLIIGARRIDQQTWLLRTVIVLGAGVIVFIVSSIGQSFELFPKPRQHTSQPGKSE